MAILARTYVWHRYKASVPCAREQTIILVVTAALHFKVVEKKATAILWPTATLQVGIAVITQPEIQSHNKHKYRLVDA